MVKMGEDDLIDSEELVEEVQKLLEQLFPICRSITGNGVRKSLSILTHISKFEVKEIQTGTKCFDWEIPNEWNVESAYLEDENGKQVLNFNENNLHLLNYSTPIDKIVSFEELKDHIHTMPELPEAIPYRTTYYSKNWGFCMSYEQFLELDSKLRYHVCIKTKLEPGSLTYGEEILKGESGIEFIISTYCCHPSMGNDNLSGMIVWILLLRELKRRKTKHGYRFIIAPETIGVIGYLQRNKDNITNVVGGYVLTCNAGPGRYEYKRSFLGNCKIDFISEEVLRETGKNFEISEFDIRGSDERQFSSPGFRIPIGVLTKSKFTEYDYYHTSLDNLMFIDVKNILSTLRIYLGIIDKLEKSQNDSFRERETSYTDSTEKGRVLHSLNPFCEPMLSKRGLFPTIGGQNHKRSNNSTEDSGENLRIEIDSIMWLMFYADGNTNLEFISDRSNIPIPVLEQAITKLEGCNLLKKYDSI
jgi:aminopeptidase-like protein